MDPIVFITIVLIFVFFSISWYRKNNPKWKKPKEEFPKDWRIVLMEEVAFYNALTEEERKEFEYKIQEFLLNCRITGIDTTVETIDKVLVASSAIIPIFEFKEWQYVNLDEVLLYPSSFNQEFDTQGSERDILGMVGNGYMEGKMILSRQALRQGFKNELDKKNTAIHEFVHLIDKTDGVIDGIPSLLIEKQYTIPWIDLIEKKIKEINTNNSDINPYGGTNKAEFFSVISEYFFERPKLLKSNHPELYALLEKIFQHDMSDRKLRNSKHKIKRNDPCPCNSGKKFKHCCGKK